MFRHICTGQTRRAVCTARHSIGRSFSAAPIAKGTQTQSQTQSRSAEQSGNGQQRTPQTNLQRRQRSYRSTGGKRTNDDAVALEDRRIEVPQLSGDTPTPAAYESLIHQIYTVRAAGEYEYANVVAFGLLDEMQSLKLHPTNTAIAHLTTIAADARDFLNVDRMLSLHRAYWLKVSPRNVSAIVDLYCATGAFEQAMEFARRQRDAGNMAPHAWYVLVRYLLDESECDSVLEMYKLGLADLPANAGSAAKQSKLLDSELFYRALVVFAQEHHADGVQWVWDVAVRGGRLLDIDDGSITLVLNMCARTGLPALATEAMQLAAKLDIQLTSHHYGCLIEAYVTTHDLRNAIAVLPIMRKAGVPPVASTADSIVKLASSSVETIEECFYTMLALHQEAAGSSAVDVAAVNAIIDACTLHSDATRAVACFDEAVASLGLVPDASTLEALLRVCVSAQQQPLATSLLDRFAKDFPSVQLTQHAYECIIVVYLLRSTYEEAFDWLERCKDEGGFIPSLKLYRALLRRLLNARDVRAKVALDELRGFGYRDQRLEAQVAKLSGHANAEDFGEDGNDTWTPSLNLANCGVLHRLQRLRPAQAPFVPAENDAELRASIEDQYGAALERSSFAVADAERPKRQNARQRTINLPDDATSSLNEATASM